MKNKGEKVKRGKGEKEEGRQHAFHRIEDERHAVSNHQVKDERQRASHPPSSPFNLFPADLTFSLNDAVTPL
jgi:hypothetical protein